ncbi:MAG: hypothetical protein IPN58_10235 [Anaerolineales bacterium]|nr:hypothetical protein [Anaerolineales bacterium]
MNKKFFWTSITLFALTLTACASSTGTPASAPSGGPSAMELPAQTKLVLGTINLEETEYPVTSEQAAELLPMFYVLQDLNDSDTAAQEEIDGLVAQIQETLTAEQTQAIDSMSLSMRDVFAISQGSSGSTSSSDAESATGIGGNAAGGPPDMGAGGPPDMGGMPSGMQSTGTTSASSDTSAAPVMDTSTPSALFDAVIALLQKKIDA